MDIVELSFDFWFIYIIFVAQIKISMGGNVNYSKQGVTFGKIVVAIIVFVVLVIYVYHHNANGIVFPQ
ncbi:MAG TPA: hypothetical protein PKD85_02850 [Saprospiraceae bacterium]|nr:hypothetical protein [Saprospiraceae bacterium]